MKLYWGSGSAPCMKAIIVMMEKGLWNDDSQKLLSFSAKEHKSEEIFKLNPRGQVPTFQDGDIVLCESGAICMYLEEKSPGLMPADPKLRAQIYQIIFEHPNFSANIVRTYLYYHFGKKPEEVDQAKLDEMAPGVDKELRLWDNKLAGKSYLVGDTFTMADVFFYPDLAMLVRQGCPLKDLGYTNLQKYYDLLQERPSIQQSVPPHWIETPSPNLMKGFKLPSVQQSAN